ncbi:hypothetical protein STAQ_30150 [Allostella sp. ATCC 35155]|nr:hypothetical protein STAQ_30150 [Stella sp. ATCC 35155]
MSLVEAIVWSILGGLAEPAIFVPAVVLGWLARTAGIAIIGGVAIAVALLAYGGMLGSLPEDAEIVWWALPPAVLPPVIWAWGSFLLFRQVRRAAGGNPGHPALRAMDMVVGALVGAAVLGAAGIGLGLLYVELAAVTTFEGAAGYLVVFGFGLPAVVLGLILGAILGWRRRRPARQA